MGAILIPLGRGDFDPSEAGISWRVLRAAGHAVVFATPDARPARADPRMLTGDVHRFAHEFVDMLGAQGGPARRRAAAAPLSCRP